MNSRERALTFEEAKRLLNELPEHQRETALFALATGLRQSNVLKLEWSQVNLELRHAWIHGTQSKTDSCAFKWHCNFSIAASEG